MNARTRHFSGSVESLHGGVPIEIGLDTAHGVVGSGPDWDAVAGEIQIQCPTLLRNMRKPLVDEVRGYSFQ